MAGEIEKIELILDFFFFLSNGGNGICWQNEAVMRNINEQMITFLVLNEPFNRCGNRNPFSTLLKTGEDIGVERNQGFFFNNVKSDYFML